VGELVAFLNVDSSRAASSISTFTRQAQAAAGSAAQRFQAVGQSITGVGQNIYGVGGQLTKGITMPVVGAVGAVGGLTAALGWGRLKSVDTAQAQLRGLGYSAQDVDRISGQLTDALADGMMTMAEGTTAAANGMAAGVKEGKELTRYIQLMDSAVVAGTGSFDEMNKIFGQTADLGYLTASNFDMMIERLPAFSKNMQEHMGVGSDALREMLNNGEVSMDDFLAVVEDGYGGMAEEMAGTWSGMAANVKNWVGIIGQTLLGGVFQQSKDSINEFIDWLTSDEVQAWAAETSTIVSAAFAKVLAAVRAVIEWWGNLNGATQKVILTIAGIVVAIGPVLMIVGKLIMTVGSMITAWGTIIGVFSKVGAVVGGAGKVFGLLSPILTVLGKGVGIVTTALRALWLTMLANPIVLIIAAVAAVVAALVWFFTQTETGKEMWASFMEWLAGAWEWIKTTAQQVWDWIVQKVVGAWTWIRDKTAEVWNVIVSWIQENWDTITRILSLLNPVTAVIRNWDLIKEASAAAWEWIKQKISDLWQGIKDAVSSAAQWVKDKVTQIWNAIKATNQTIWNAIKTAISNVWNGIKNAISNALNVVRNFISSGWNGAKNLTTNAWNSMRNAVSNGVSGVVNFVRGLPGKILSALGNIGNTLYNSGRSLIDGFKNGITNAFSNAVNAVRNGMNRIRSFFPFSPAKEGPFSGKGYTIYSGQALTEDFAKGMAMAERDVVRQAEAITRAAALDVPDVAGVNGPALDGPQRGRDSEASAAPTAGTNITFVTHNPVAEPTSETARKASAYIGVSV
jgi:tape measure domain-containing protein